MISLDNNKIVQRQTRYIFGATTAIITNLGLMAGLYHSPDAKLTIIGGILVIALADNLSDSLGIHIYQEAENRGTKEVWVSTISNFITRFFVSLIFIAIIILFPLRLALVYSIILGLVLLTLISYLIAVKRSRNPYWDVLEHLAIALAVIVGSKYLGQYIAGKF